MKKATDHLTVPNIKKMTDLKSLQSIILIEQADYWYDPCGKSGEDINRRLTDKSVAAVKRLRFLLGLDGKGGGE